MPPGSNVPGGVPSATSIEQKAIDLIVASEVTSQAVYNKLYHRPTWPEGQSGVTVGIGYDVGYSTPTKLNADWNGRLSATVINRLKDACGVTGAAAQSIARAMANEGIDVPWDHAMAVFLTRDIPAWVGTVERALPNTNMLSKTCLGVLVSLAYNRGASFSKAGERYTEMRNIKTHMTNQQFAKIPDEIRSMKRLWPDLKGLRIRRDAEADLFQGGLTQAPGA
jgi:GH24 family phage-related lysozyme (muramidase)